MNPPEGPSSGALRALRTALTGHGYEPPTPLARDGLYHPDAPDGLTLDEWQSRFARPDLPTVGILFYLFEVIIVVGIQAFIFAALSAIYIGSAIEPEH